mgnify:CR=1 FL=1
MSLFFWFAEAPENVCRGSLKCLLKSLEMFAEAPQIFNCSYSNFIIANTTLKNIHIHIF